MSTIRKLWKSAVCRGRPLRSLRLLAAALTTVSTLCAAPVVQAAPGDIIENTAIARYSGRSGLEEIRVSNIDNLVVAQRTFGPLPNGQCACGNGGNGSSNQADEEASPHRPG